MYEHIYAQAKQKQPDDPLTEASHWLMLFKHQCLATFLREYPYTLTFPYETLAPIVNALTPILADCLVGKEVRFDLPPFFKVSLVDHSTPQEDPTFVRHLLSGLPFHLLKHGESSPYQHITSVKDYAPQTLACLKHINVHRRLMAHLPDYLTAFYLFPECPPAPSREASAKTLYGEMKDAQQRYQGLVIELERYLTQTLKARYRHDPVSFELFTRDIQQLTQQTSNHLVEHTVDLLAKERTLATVQQQLEDYRASESINPHRLLLICGAFIHSLTTHSQVKQRYGDWQKPNIEQLHQLIDPYLSHTEGERIDGLAKTTQKNLLNKAIATLKKQKKEGTMD